MPRNAIQILFDDGSVQVLAPVVQPVPASPPPPPASAVIKGGYFDGIPDNQAKMYADQFGMTWVRIWHVVNWAERIGPAHPTLIRARALQAQGLKVLCVCTPPEKTGAPAANPDIAAAYFTSMNSAAAGCIDAWEIFNEPSLANYNISYASNSTLWVKNALVPAYDVLHPAKQFVVSGGWSGNPGDKNGAVAWMVKNGLLDHCDAVGFHPYGSTASQQLAYIQQMRSLIGEKPLWISEWNLHADVNQPASWMVELAEAAADIAPYVNAVFHFRMTYNTSQAGVAAPFTAAGEKRDIWYDGTVAAMGAI